MSSLDMTTKIKALRLEAYEKDKWVDIETMELTDVPQPPARQIDEGDRPNNEYEGWET